MSRRRRRQHDTGRENNERRLSRDSQPRHIAFDGISADTRSLTHAHASTAITPAVPRPGVARDASKFRQPQKVSRNYYYKWVAPRQCLFNAGIWSTPTA